MATKVAGFVFLLVALAHFSRFLFHFHLMIGTWSPPLWVNGVAGVVALGLALWLWGSRK